MPIARVVVSDILPDNEIRASESARSVQVLSGDSMAQPSSAPTLGVVVLSSAVWVTTSLP